ncbi:LysM peptidoglycan-binding domain-containing protein [Candidatus Daviesbacteria bacterium]|nr:LysM peptidoglycan-binding domain-containing protein [Candidatus Daviesbacteria bacterium]
MARGRSKKVKKSPAKTTVRVERTSKKEQSFFERIQTDIQKNNSLLNLILGALIVIVLGILVFNYFSRDNGTLGPSQQTDLEEQTQEDVSKENLPGKYTVKEGDTLYSIAEKYYGDGFKFNELVRPNNLPSENSIEVGQVLEIPKIDFIAQSSPVPADQQATGGAENQTIWGEKITGNTYTVQPDDWLSKIAGRAYGDVMTYERIAQANNIQNPDLIEVGTVLKIPR